VLGKRGDNREQLAVDLKANTPPVGAPDAGDMTALEVHLSLMELNHTLDGISMSSPSGATVDTVPFEWNSRLIYPGVICNTLELLRT
jgi:hypothetical protein